MSVAESMVSEVSGTVSTRPSYRENKDIIGMAFAGLVAVGAAGLSGAVSTLLFNEDDLAALNAIFGLDASPLGWLPSLLVSLPWVCTLCFFALEFGSRLADCLSVRGICHPYARSGFMRVLFWLSSLGLALSLEFHFIFRGISLVAAGAFGPSPSPVLADYGEDVLTLLAMLAVPTLALLVAFNLGTTGRHLRLIRRGSAALRSVPLVRWFVTTLSFTCACAIGVLASVAATIVAGLVIALVGLVFGILMLPFLFRMLTLAMLFDR